MLGIGMKIPRIEGGNFDGWNGAFSLDFVAMEVDMEVDHEKIEVEMYKEAQTPFYEGCPSSWFASILLLLNLVSTHGVSNKLICGWTFHIVAGWIVP